MHALIFGAPGSGKGTYSSRLQRELDIEVISTGDIFRDMLKQDSPLGKKVKWYVESGLLVPNAIVLEVLLDRLNKIPPGKGFMLDGFPRTIDQAEALNGITKLDVVLQIDVPDWIIIERLSSRRICKNCGAVYNTRFLKPKVEGVCDKCGGPLYQREDDTVEVIQRRLDVYKKQTSPLVTYYRQQGLPFIVQKTEVLDLPPENVVKWFVEELKKLKLA